MKKAWCFLFAFLILPSVLAISLDIQIEPVKDVVIVGVDDRVEYELSVENKGDSETFQIYSLVEADFQPKDFFVIEKNGVRNLDVKVKFREETLEKVRGAYVFSYEIKGQNSGFYNGKLNANVIEIQDAFEIEEIRIDPSDSEARIFVKNKVNYDFSDVRIRISSEFFEDEFSGEFLAGDTLEFITSINRDLSKELIAGDYGVISEFEFGEVSGESQSVLKYLEEGGISVLEESSGTIVKKTLIIRTNQGNIVSVADFEASRNLITRLFTTFSSEPDRVEESGFFVNYYWNQELKPGESYSIEVSTNYTFPFALIILIFVVILIAKFYFKGDLKLEKRVSFVKTKGGEFALRVKIRVKARKGVDHVEITDRIPAVTKLYDKYGKGPDRIDHNGRTLHWDVKSLSAGEERVFSYIIYSKINVVGRFDLPRAHAVYKKDGKMERVESNHTSFASESAED